jgi:hypothetical protein
MIGDFGSVCDDFYVSTRLFLKLEMALDRETVLHFFDRLRKEFPRMTKFRRRDDGCLVLEEDTVESPSRHWVRLEPYSLRFGHFAPPNSSSLREMAAVVLEHAPYHLTFNDLDYDHLEVVYGFDLNYRGNHDRLIAETLWADHPLAALLLSREAVHPIDAQPYFGFALNDTCDVQAYVEVKSRSTTYEVRTGQFEEQPLSVYLTVRKYWGTGLAEPLVEVHRKLYDWAEELAADKVVPILVTPLAQAIARS